MKIVPLNVRVEGFVDVSGADLAELEHATNSGIGEDDAAAKALRLPNTTVTRRVQDLETRLGAQLLHRTTRKLGLTEAGNLYFGHCRHIARDLDEAESAVGQLQSGPRGWLRVTATHPLGSTWIAPLLGEFVRAIPTYAWNCY